MNIKHGHCFSNVDISKSPKKHASMQVLIPRSGLVLRCYFFNRLWFWWPSTSLSGAGIHTTDYLCQKWSVLSGLSLILQIWLTVDLGPWDFNQQLKFTYSCPLPQSTILFQARTVLHSVFLLLKSQEMFLKLTSCSVNAFLKLDFNKHL